MIPFMRLDRQFESIREQVMTAVTAVFATGNVLQSEEVVDFEQRVAGLCGTKYAVAVNSGTDALIFALLALELPRGSRIGVTTMSFVASASAIVNAGYKPVFFDVEPDSMLMDIDSVTDAVAKGKVDAVLAVHLYGQSLDIETIRAATDAKGIPLVEDAAQSLGARRHGKPVGGTGLAGCLSFDPTKVVGAYGSGGAVITNDDAFAKRIRLLRYHGHAGDQRYVVTGFNSQLDSVQAVILNAKLDHLDEWQQRRQSIAARYDAALGRTGLRAMSVLSGNIHNYHKYVVWAPDRASVQAYLGAAGVQTKVQYPVPLHRQPLFGTLEMTFPKVEAAAEHIFSLPIYAELSDNEVTTVCGALESLSQHL